MDKYFLFKITIWNETHGDEEKACGLVAAPSYSQALNRIIGDYSEDSLCSIDSIIEIEGICETLTLNEAMYHMFIHFHNEDEIDSYHLKENESSKGKTYFDFPGDESK